MKNREKVYLEVLIDALHPSGDILEVGFRSGYAAELIQKYHPESHTIIESDAVAAKEAKKWIGGRASVTLIEQPWQTALPRLAVFDVIFFALREEEQIIPQLTKMRYGDADLEAFCEKSGKEAPEQVYRFLHELEHTGQISKEQKEKMIRKFHLKGKDAPPFKAKRSDNTLPFLEQCLASHMRKGSRFSCFLEDAASKSEDPRFFDRIIANPLLDYKEKLVSLPEGHEALIILIEKLA